MSVVLQVWTEAAHQPCAAQGFQEHRSHREMDPHTPPVIGAVDMEWAELSGIGKAEFAEHRALRVEVDVQEVRCGS